MDNATTQAVFQMSYFKDALLDPFVLMGGVAGFPFRRFRWVLLTAAGYFLAFTFIVMVLLLDIPFDIKFFSVDMGYILILASLVYYVKHRKDLRF